MRPVAVNFFRAYKRLAEKLPQLLYCIKYNHAYLLCKTMLPRLCFRHSILPFATP